jgi:hypothetical protein
VHDTPRPIDWKKVDAITRKLATLPVLDPRAADEILGYDEFGLPRCANASGEWSFETSALVAMDGAAARALGFAAGGCKIVPFDAPQAKAAIAALARCALAALRGETVLATGNDFQATDLTVVPS